jgi:hypothetical protein
MNGTPQFTAEGVLLSRFSHSSLPCDQLGQLRGDLFPGAFKAS